VRSKSTVPTAYRTQESKDDEKERTFTKINIGERISTVANKRKTEEKERLKKFKEREKLVADRLQKRKSELLEFVSDKRIEWDQRLNLVKNNKRLSKRNVLKNERDKY